jgi:hypothetical protein
MDDGRQLFIASEDSRTEWSSCLVTGRCGCGRGIGTGWWLAGPSADPKTSFRIEQVSGCVAEESTALVLFLDGRVESSAMVAMMAQGRDELALLEELPQVTAATAAAAKFEEAEVILGSILK